MTAPRDPSKKSGGHARREYSAEKKKKTPFDGKLRREDEMNPRVKPGS
jgi:hypothetical protein